MADVTDASGTRGRVERQRELLEEASIDDRDRDAIQRYVRHRRVHGTSDGGDYALNTEKNDLCFLRLSADRGPTPLVDMGLDDCNELLATLTAPKSEGGYAISSGIEAYPHVLRPFFEWLDAHDEYGEYAWYEQLSTGTADRPDPSEREFPSQSQIDEMIEAARRSNNPRNAALVSFLADAAVRRTLCAQLRVGDVSLGGDRPTFTPNDDAEAVGQKGVPVKAYPLYDCVADLRVWVRNYHPDPEVNEAPLWPTDDYDSGAPEKCAVSTSRIAGILNDLADEAGIPGVVEVKPHAFRHAAVGRWKEMGYTLQQVQRRTAWTDESAAEMWARYGDPDDARIDAGIDQIEGRDPPADVGDESTDPVERYDCGTCGATGWTTDHCGQCGSAVSPGAKAAEVDETTRQADAEEEIARTLERLPAEAAAELAETILKFGDTEVRTEVERHADHD